MTKPRQQSFRMVRSEKIAVGLSLESDVSVNTSATGSGSGTASQNSDRDRERELLHTPGEPRLSLVVGQFGAPTRAADADALPGFNPDN